MSVDSTNAGRMVGATTETDMTDAAPKTYELMVCAFEKNPRYCVYLNDYRIAGSKPWGGSHAETTWHVTPTDICEALPDVRGMVDALQRLASPAPGVKKLPPWAIGIAVAALERAGFGVDK